MAGSVTIGALRVSMGLDSAQFESGAKRALHTAKGLEGGLRATSVATRQLNTAFGGTAPNARNIAMQLSQVGQSAMVTGNFVQALAIQLPDLGIMFGAVGAAAGLVAGIALPMLVAALTGASGGALTLSQALENTEDALAGTKEVMDLLSMSSAELNEQFSGLGSGFDALVDARAAQSLRELNDAAAGLTDTLAAMFGGSAFFNVSRAEDLANGLRVTTQESRNLEQALNNLGAAGSLKEQQDAAASLRLTLIASVGDVENMTKAEFEFYSAIVDTEEALARVAARTRDINDGLGTGNNILTTMIGVGDSVAASIWGIGDAAGGIIPNLMAAANAAWDLANATQVFRGASGGSADSGGAGTPPPGRPQTRPDDIDFGLSDLTPSGGGGAASAVEDLGKAFAGLMEQLDPVLAATNKFAEQQDVLNAALEAGIATQADYAAAMAAARKEYDETIADLDDQKTAFDDLGQSISDDLGGALGDFMASGMSDWESFNESLVSTASNAVAQIVAEYAAAQIGGMFGGPIGSIIGGLAGGLFSGIFGGGGPSALEENQDRAAQERYDLTTAQLQLQGKQNALAEREIALLMPGNQAWARRLQLMEREVAIDAEAKGLKEQLLQIQGDQEALDRIWLDTLDKKNRALGEEILAEQAAQEAEQEAEAAAQSLADQKLALEKEILGLQGDTAALRALELEATDDSLDYLLETKYALEDMAEVTSEIAAALKAEDFSTLLDFNRASALARNGVAIPASGIPAYVPAAPAVASASGDPVVIELRAVKAELAAMKSLLTTTQGFTKEIRNVQIEWAEEEFLVKVS